jgi:hypothetical protein
MWKFLLALLAVLGLVVFGNAEISGVHIPTYVVFAGGLGLVFLAGLLYSQRI